MDAASTDINDLGLTGFTVRPLTPSDAHAVFELMAECEREILDEVAIEEADIVSDWQRPSFDLATQSIGVFDGVGPDAPLIGYAEVAHWLKGREQTVRGPGNPYEAWIAMYEGAAFQEAAAAAVAWLNGQLAEVGARRMTQLTRIFRDATRLEADFWDMGLHQRL